MSIANDVNSSELLVCPFCGSPCDECQSEDNEEYYGCENQKCGARMLAMTRREWNNRPTEQQLVEGLLVVRAMFSGLALRRHDEADDRILAKIASILSSVGWDGLLGGEH